MAFDQTTRNRLNRFVADSRVLLSDEFTRQLQSIYGMNPVSGEVADLNALSGLTPHQQETARLLRDTFEHYLAANDHENGKSKEKQNRIAALDRIVREQAFTVLNRLAALRMSEARGFLTESLSKGYDSKGFQLFHRLAGNSLGETGESYVYYLFSIFDEFALDLSVLFDRFSAQGRLFPSSPVLLELLGLINQEEIASLWAEDETIGWIYQYFNSQEERKKMRDASQAPRNSRELAVRNQFFTPRYVVEFLTDNTLGRIWYEMTKGQTKLVKECEYLVRRPNEIFLKQGEEAPEQESTEGLSQEELLKQTVYIEHRDLKDPRDIRMLDPACGSMHFGLYCFDLFELIYSEAWDIELKQGAEAFERESNHAPLTQTYLDKAEFLKHVPRLIIENNIHGVDIDPRAAQVAGMSLWQRAHNSWQKASVKPQLRPQITKSNIVCAEPMPGEKELLQEFTSQLKPTVLGQLVEVIFEKMQLAGEAGTLLKIEKEIEYAIARAKETWQQQSQALSQFPDLAKVAKQQNVSEGELNFDVSDINDKDFWQQVEQKILQALMRYSKSTSSEMTEQKRLFASDASKGFAFIDLCKKRFDVALMNPPFGQPSIKSINDLENNYPTTFLEMYAAFASRGLELLNDKGILGSISSRAFLTINRLQKWREQELIDHLDVLLDLGQGVMDAAMVESAAYIVKREATHKHLYSIDATNIKADERHFWSQKQLTPYIVPREKLKKLPRMKILYSAPEQLYDLFSNIDVFEPDVGTVRQGMGTFDDFRFVHLSWEVPYKDKGEGRIWEPLTKGGSYARFYSDIHLVLNWSKDGAELSAINISKNGQDAQVKQASGYWRRAGATYSKRSQKGFSARALPNNCILTGKGPAILSLSDVSNSYMLGWINSRLIRSVIEMQANFGEYNTGILKSLPWKAPLERAKEIESEVIQFLNKKIRVVSTLDETNSYYSGIVFDNDIFSTVDFLNSQIDELNNSEKRLTSTIDAVIDDIYNIDSSILVSEDDVVAQEVFSSVSPKDVCYRFVSYFVGVALGRWADRVDVNIEKFQEQYEPFGSLPLNPRVVLFKSEGCILSNDKLAVRVKELISTTCNSKTYEDIISCLKIEDLQDYLTNSNSFFSEHISTYSKSRRQAPIYWPIQSYNGTFTFWFYYQSLNSQSLIKCINDELEPLLEDLKKEISILDSQAMKSKEEERKIDLLYSQVSELQEFISELLKVNKLWSPNLNDGVQLTAAPLWRLFQHKAWQKKLKQTWEKLEEGEYDWAHLAFSTWPERVLKKCYADRSLAIAHDVEDDLWHEVEVIKGKKKEPVWEWQPKPLSETELRTYIKEKIATDDRLKLYRSNQSNNAKGGAW